MTLDTPPLNAICVVVKHIWNDTDTVKLIGKKIKVIQYHPAEIVSVLVLNTNSIIQLHIKEIGKVPSDLIITRPLEF